MMLSFSLCLVTDVSAEHLPAVVSCCSIDQAEAAIPRQTAITVNSACLLQN